MLIKITFIHENTFLKESFITRVLILPKSPIEIILGRKTIKAISFANKTPSHFSWDKTLSSQQMPDGTFGVTQEIHDVCIHPNHDRAKALPGAKGHAQTCIRPLVLRGEAAGLESDSRKKKLHEGIIQWIYLCVLVASIYLRPHIWTGLISLTQVIPPRGIR